MNLKKLTQKFDDAARTFQAVRPSVGVDEVTLLQITNGFGQRPNFEPSSSAAPENRL